MIVFGRTLPDLKTIIATVASRDWAAIPALILFWLQLRRLTTCLDEMFAAWRSGALPPQPTQPLAPATSPIPPAATRPRAVSRHAAMPRRRTRAPRPAQARSTGAARPRQVWPPPAHSVPFPARIAVPRLLSKKCDILARTPHCAHIIALT